MLYDHFEPGLISISPNNKSRRCLKLFIKCLIPNIESGKVKFVFVILSDAPLKLTMNEELRKITNKEKTIRIKNDILNDFLKDVLDKRLVLVR